MVVEFPLAPSVETFIEETKHDGDVSAAILQPSSEHPQQNKTAA